jgi:hypothetical protein
MDQVGVRQSVSVALCSSPVEAIDLRPAAAVSKGAVGDAPQTVVDAVTWGAYHHSRGRALQPKFGRIGVELADCRGFLSRSAPWNGGWLDHAHRSRGNAGEQGCHWAHRQQRNDDRPNEHCCRRLEWTGVRWGGSRTGAHLGRGGANEIEGKKPQTGQRMQAKAFSRKWTLMGASNVARASDQVGMWPGNGQPM